MAIVIGLIVGLALFGILLGLFGLARFMYKERVRSCRFLAALFIAVGIFFLSWVIAASSVPQSARGRQYNIAIIIGLFTLAIGVGANVLYFLFEFWRDEGLTLPPSGDLPEDRWIANITHIVKQELEPTNAQLMRIEQRLLDAKTNGTTPATR